MTLKNIIAATHRMVSRYCIVNHLPPRDRLDRVQRRIAARLLGIDRQDRPEALRYWLRRGDYR